MKNVLILFCLTLISCEQKSQLFGTWYHLGLNKTENTYYNETEWNARKDKFANLESNPDPAIQNQRNDLYEKLTLKNDGTFVSQLIVLKTNTAFEKPLKGTWKLENNSLALTVKKNDSELQRVYNVQSILENELGLKISKEIIFEDGKKISNYDLSIKEEAFKDLIEKIRIENNDFYAKKQDEYVDDFWEILNFGKYQVLSRRINQDDDISKFDKSIQDVINGYCWDYVPYYEPIFENTHERLIFNTDDKLIIRFKDLSSQSGGCGTLSNSDYSTEWNWNKLENTVEITFNGNEKIPFEILNLFHSEELKNEKFKILAKNDKVMIWEKIE